MKPRKPLSNASQRVRDWNGPAVLAYGYRPFFLLAGLWAAIAMAGWLAMLSGWPVVMSRFDPVSWHAHEMLFGYLGAVMAGYLLMAIPNWTGQLPNLGWPLFGLAMLWILGRVGIAFSAYLSPLVAALMDLALPLVLLLALGREVLTGKAWRNLPLLALLAVFLAANGMFHLTEFRSGRGGDGMGLRIGLAVGVMMITLVGGRIVPSFSRSWFVKQNLPHRPAPFGAIDRLAVAISVISLLAWIIAPLHLATAVLGLGAGLAHMVRLSRWQGWHTRAEPLLWILHVGYGFVPLGFLALGLPVLGVEVIPSLEAQHLWMAGAIGVMTLAMMSRTGLAHGGRAPRATHKVAGVFILVLTAVVLRVIAGMVPTPDWPLRLSAGAWIGGYLGFVLLHWPILTQRHR